MYDYSIETFLLDVYYPVALENDGNNQSSWQRIKQLGKRFLELIKSAINALTRFIKTIKEKITGKEYLYATKAEFNALDKAQTILAQVTNLVASATDDRGIMQSIKSGSINASELQTATNSRIDLRDKLRNIYRSDELIDIEDSSKDSNTSNIRISKPKDKYSSLFKNLTSLTKYWQSEKEYADVMLTSASANLEISREILNMVIKLSNAHASAASTIMLITSKVSKLIKKLVTSVNPDKTNDKDISAEFKKTVESGNKLRTRIILTNYVIADPSFKTFDASLAYAKRNIQDFMDTHDGEKFEDDTSKWTKDYLNKQLNNLVDNFSQERVNFVRKLAKHIYHK